MICSGQPRLLLQLCLASCLVPLWAVPASAQAASATSPVPSLPMINVFASDGKTGAPDTTLTRDELLLLDDGKPAAIASFDAPRSPGLRPLAVWLIVQCPLYAEKNSGSGFLRDYEANIAPGLTHLHPGDTVGIAHWCDDGVSAIDLKPTRDLRQVEPTLHTLLAPKVKPPNDAYLGETALQTMIHDIDAQTVQTSPRPMPVMIFFHGDHTGAPPRQVDQLAYELLELPGVVFVINNGLANRPPTALGEVPYILSRIAAETGGSAFHVPFTPEPLAYAYAVAAVLDSLHARYQLTFVPRRLDNEWHPVSVRLSPAARKTHPSVSLRQPEGYFAMASANAH